MKHASGFTFTSFVVGVLVLSVIPAPFSTSQTPVNQINGTPVGWSDNIKLTDDSLTNVDCEIALSGEKVHVIWEQNNPSNGDDYLVYIKSNDNGETWEPMQNFSNTTYVRVHPDIKATAQNVHVVWEDYRGSEISRIYYRNSTDDGETWNPEKRISSPAGLRSVAPHMFVNNSNIHIIWLDLRNSDEEIYYRHSLDGGITFDNGQGVDEDRRISFSPDDVSSINLAGDGSNISVVWSDERNGNWEIYWMITKDNGFTWEDGLGNIGQDRRLTFTGAEDSAVAMNGSNIHVVYIDPVDIFTYNLYYINSTNQGANWNSPVLLSGPSSMINSPDISVEGDNVYVVWGDEIDDGDHEEIYYKNSTDGGISWSGDIRLTFNPTEWSWCPRIAVQNEIKHVVWFDWYGSTNRDVIYKRSPDFPLDPTYNITLNEGWNLVSLPLEQSDESIDQVLQSINGKWDYIQVYDAINDIWLSNATFKPDQLNDFSTLNHKQGFWINITEPGGTILTVSGYDPPSTSIPLYAGWNLVGYPSLTNETVANALWGTGADSVEVFDPGKPYRIKEVGATYVMKPGEGYWVHVVANSTWTVNW